MEKGISETTSEVETKGGESPEGNGMRHDGVMPRKGEEASNWDDEGGGSVKLKHRGDSRLEVGGSHSILSPVERSRSGSKNPAREEEEDLEVPRKGARYSEHDCKPWTNGRVAELRDG